MYIKARFVGLASVPPPLLELYVNELPSKSTPPTGLVKNYLFQVLFPSAVFVNTPVAEPPFAWKPSDIFLIPPVKLVESVV